MRLGYSRTLLPCLLLAGSVHAATVTVTSLDDAADIADLRDNGGCTLREALAAAEARQSVDSCVLREGEDASGPVRITFAAALAGGVLEMAPDSASFEVVVDTVLAGSDMPNATAITLHRPDGASDDAVLRVREGATLTLSSMLISGGRDSGIQVAANARLLGHDLLLIGNRRSQGGALVNQGETRLHHVDLRDNHATGYGGAVSNSHGELFMSEVMIEHNSAGTGAGGLINVTGRVDVRDSTFAHNDGGFIGGGFHNYAMSGGAYPRAPMSMHQVTLSGNQVTGNGGGFYNDGGELDMTNATIVFNESGAIGAGFFNIVVNGIGYTNVRNTLAARNVQDGTVQRSCNYGFPVSGSHTFCGERDWDYTDEVTPQLADVGGATLTHLPLAGAEILNAGSDDLLPEDEEGQALPFDQRGEGFPRQIGNVDIGAVEGTEDGNTAPYAVALIPDNAPRDGEFAFAVMYADNARVNHCSLAACEQDNTLSPVNVDEPTPHLHVLGPDDTRFELGDGALTLERVPVSARQVTASYRFTLPASAPEGWRDETFRIVLADDQVADFGLTPKFAEGGVLGEFVPRHVVPPQQGGGSGGSAGLGLMLGLMLAGLRRLRAS